MWSNSLCARFALAGSRRLLLPGGGQLRLPVAEAADQELFPLGKRVQELLTMFGRHAAGDPLQQKRLRQLAIVACGHGEPLGNGWQPLAAPQQEQVLNRTGHDAIPVELLQPDEPVLDVFLVGEPCNRRVRPAQHRNQGHVEEVGRIGSGIDENAALKR